MTPKMIIDEMEREAAKFRTTDLQHQSDQSMHYQEIFKMQKGMHGKQMEVRKPDQKKG